MLKGKVSAEMFDDLAKKLDALTTTVATIVQSQPQQGTQQAPNVEYSDPVVKVCEDEQMKAIASMPEGTVIVKGKRGSQMINQSMQKLDAISNFLRDRNQFGAIRRV